MRVTVEICVTSVEEALAAEKTGADSVEICSWLACGGLTPSPGIISWLKERTQLKKRVLVRPTPGGFRYSADERQILLRDALMIGVADPSAGVVTGALDQLMGVDTSTMEAVKLTLAGRELTFHRAIDHAADLLVALDQCLSLGVQRVLTSGGETLALDGLPVLKQMVERAGGKLLIAAAGGINASNVVELVEKTGVTEVHFSAQKPKDGTPAGAAMSSTNVGVNFETEPDVAKIEGVMNALVNAGLR